MPLPNVLFLCRVCNIKCCPTAFPDWSLQTKMELGYDWYGLEYWSAQKSQKEIVSHKKKKPHNGVTKKRLTIENGPSEYRNTTNFSNYEANNKDSTVMMANHYHAKHYLPLWHVVRKVIWLPCFVFCSVSVTVSPLSTTSIGSQSFILSECSKSFCFSRNIRKNLL